MAASYVDYSGKYVRVNDQLLTIIVAFLRHCAYKHSEISIDVLSQIDLWQDETLNAPPGLITLDMKGFWETNEGRSLLRKLIEESVQEIRSFGLAVPKRILESLTPNAAPIQFVDVDTSLILKYVKAISEIF